MNWFATPERVAALDAAAGRWVGTPWRPNSRVRGVGASCHHAVAGVLRDAGCEIPSVPDGQADWSRHQTTSVQEAWLDSRPQVFASVDVESVQPGDIVGFQLGNCIHHLGLVLSGGRFCQCLKSTGFVILGCHEPDFRLAKRAWRPLDQSYGR